MMLALSLICMIAGPVLYFALSFAGIYRLYPVESYGLMTLAVWLTWRTARRAGGWWRYGVCGLTSFMLVIFIYWTAFFSQLPEQKLSVTVGQPFIPIVLTDHQDSPFDSTSLVGKNAALYLFYRGNW
jgi:hypothetical protein